MNPETVQLIKCQVRNRDNQISYRLIERDNYDLWQFLVTKKHHITIIESSLCLWMDQEEFANKQEIYERAGTSEVANRILLMMFDDHGSFNHTCRYALDADTAEVEKILSGHIPKIQKQQNQFTLDIEAGYIVTTGPFNKLNLTASVEQSGE